MINNDLLKFWSIQPKNRLVALWFTWGAQKLSHWLLHALVYIDELPYTMYVNAWNRKSKLLESRLVENKFSFPIMIAPNPGHWHISTWSQQWWLIAINLYRKLMLLAITSVKWWQNDICDKVKTLQISWRYEASNNEETNECRILGKWTSSRELCVHTSQLQFLCKNSICWVRTRKFF